VLGFLSITVTAFIAMFPGNLLGVECAAIFAIFTSQAWNMAFSAYQGFRTVPAELKEAARVFKLSGWQTFWRLELPFAMPRLLWNMMMSMSGGWFFVVASEAFQPEYKATGHWFVYCTSHRAERSARHRLGDWCDADRRPALRSIVFPSTSGLG
jgi:ABC-type anion transport system duplicated permease subunit